MKTKLSKSQMRVAIAKDVIKQLKAGVYIPAGTYFWVATEGTFSGLLSNENVQEEVLKLQDCKVCAIGAAFVSGVRLFDGISGKNWDIYKGSNSVGAQSFFTRKQLCNMEEWFEVTKWPLTTALEDKILRMHRSQRMRIVFRSIIANNGQVKNGDIKKRFEKARVLSHP